MVKKVEQSYLQTCIGGCASNRFVDLGQTTVIPDIYTKAITRVDISNSYAQAKFYNFHIVFDIRIIVIDI